MPISHSYKTIFVHIPKTAGTSVENVLGIGGNMPSQLRSHKIQNIKGIKYAPQHYTASILKNHPYTQPYWNKYFKFSVVRHPYSRVLSEWFWVRGKTTKNLEWDGNKLTQHLYNFYASLDRDHKLSQTTFLYEKGNCLVDRIFRFENLPPLNTVLKRKCGVKKVLPHVQQSSNKQSYLQKLTTKHKDLIYEIYKDDFENFNYKK